jgi:hypothetical protein
VKHLWPLLVAAVLLAPGAVSAASKPVAVKRPVTIKTSWHESFQFTSQTRHGELKLHVTKLEVSAETWKAWVGVTNLSPMAVSLQAKLEKPYFDKPFVYWAGPGLWWSTLERDSSWYPGGGTVLTHSARAGSVQPAYPKTIAKGKSWYGTFSGSLAKVPKDRLLRVGFGALVLPPEYKFSTDTNPKEVPVSTTHQFKLPR